jgi:hypothetical protein
VRDVSSFGVLIEGLKCINKYHQMKKRAPISDEAEAPERKMGKAASHDLTIDSIVDTFFERDPAVKAMCKATKDDDPPVMFAWINVHTFVESIPHVHIPPPFALPQNPSVAEFKTALLNFVRLPGSQLPQVMAILPCTITEFSHVCCKLAKLENNPWFVAVAAHNPHGVPIASLVTPLPRRNFVGVAYFSPPDAPCRLWGEL